jgi:hypothetical protein
VTSETKSTGWKISKGDKIQFLKAGNKWGEALIVYSIKKTSRGGRTWFEMKANASGDELQGTLHGYEAFSSTYLNEHLATWRKVEAA